MIKLVPEKISRPKSYLITCKWSDGYESTIALEKLREECPCAECKGESMRALSGGLITMPGMKQFNDGMNELESLTPVGNYAISAAWKDGHDSGIYTWADFRRAFETHALSLEQLAKLEQK